MRKLILGLFILLLITGGSATSIHTEEVEIDLATSTVNVDMHVEDLTSSKFTYFVNYPISNLHATSDGEELDCEIDNQQIESQISCETSKKEEFHVHMNFTISDVVSSEQKTRIFQYSEDFIRPTENYTLRVILPEGAGLVDGKNVSTPVVSPQDADIGSNGRRITIEWDRKPTVGDRLSFRVIYEELSTPFNYMEIIAAALLAFIGIALGYIGYRRITRENIDSRYEDLSEDQIAIIELLRENSGEMLQKDVVESLDYSKAKISGLVSELVEEEILVKEKEGRSNKLQISKHFSH